MTTATTTQDILDQTIADLESDGVTVDLNDRVAVVTEEGREITVPRAVVVESGEFDRCEDCGSNFAPEVGKSLNCTFTLCVRCDRYCHAECFA